MHIVLTARTKGGVTFVKSRSRCRGPHLNVLEGRRLWGAFADDNARESNLHLHTIVSQRNEGRYQDAPKRNQV